MIVTGKCYCTAVSYSFHTEAAPAVYACHCRDCQTRSGSAFALHSLLPADKLKVTGPLQTCTHDSNGQRSEHRLCSLCHTRIYNTTTAAPGLCVLRAGTLDDSPSLQPVAHIWLKHKQPWLVLAESPAHWQESPTPEQFALALAAC